MRAVGFWLISGLAVVVWAGSESPSYQFPWIAGHGGVVPLPQAVEPPRAGARVVLDIVADSPVTAANKGLESAARYLNLHAQSGLPRDQVRLACVLHGQATKAALNQAAYQRVTQQAINPNLELIAALRGAGVEVFVCGQSLARNGYPVDDVAENVQVAVSALTVNVNKQAAGYAYVAIH